MKPDDRRRLRAALDAEYPAPHPSLAYRVLPPHHRRPERRLGGLAAAATLLIVIVVAAAVFVAHRDAGGAARRPALPPPASPTAAPVPDPTLPATPSMFSPAWFVSSQVGWLAADGSLEKTTDGGAHWTRQLSLAYPKLFARDMRFLDEQTGFVAPVVFETGHGTSALYATTDGVHWERRTMPLTSNPVSGMDFVSASEGYVLADVAGAPAVFHTADGGRTWQRIATVPGGMHLEGMRFRDATHGWIAATTLSPPDRDATPSLLATADGGHTWQPQALPAPPGITYPVASDHLEPPQFTDPMHGYAAFLAAQPPGATPGAGKFGTQAVLVYGTTDGGVSWSPLGISPGAALASAVLDERDLLVVTDTESVVSRDRGATWGHLGALPGRASWVDFPNPRDGFAGDPGSGALLVTHDGGRTWAAL